MKLYLSWIGHVITDSPSAPLISMQHTEMVYHYELLVNKVSPHVINNMQDFFVRLCIFMFLKVYLCPLYLFAEPLGSYI